MSSTLTATDGARGATAPSSANVPDPVDEGFTADHRVRLLGQLRAATYDVSEHKDVFTYGWNSGIEYAIRALFPLPAPTYSCRFPLTCGVSLGLRELASAAFAGVVAVDLSDCGDR